MVARSLFTRVLRGELMGQPVESTGIHGMSPISGSRPNLPARVRRLMTCQHMAGSEVAKNSNIGSCTECRIHACTTPPLHKLLSARSTRLITSLKQLREHNTSRHHRLCTHPDGHASYDHALHCRMGVCLVQARSWPKHRTSPPPRLKEVSPMAAASFVPLRRTCSRCGATPAEGARPLPGCHRSQD